MAVDNRTGGILALVGGRDFSQSEYDRALQSKRPAGTAFTPFVFTAALEKGVFPGSLFEDSPLDNRQVMIGGTTGILGEWGVERADNQYEGASADATHFCVIEERGDGPSRRRSWFGFRPQTGEKSWNSR